MSKQQGSTLFIVLIVVVAMLAATATLIRTSHTTGLVAQNTAFKAAATQAADVGIAAAMTALVGNVALNSSIANQYFPTQQAVDSYGLPTTVTWSLVPSTAVQQYQVQTVTERLCSGALPVASITNQCSIATMPVAGSNKVGTPSYSAASLVFYRITAMVTGPRSTVSYVQAIVSR